MIDCSIFQNNIKGDPFVPQVLRRNYGNTPAAPDEVQLDDNSNKDANVLSTTTGGDPIFDINAEVYSTKRQQTPYPIAKGTTYPELYDAQVKANYELQVVPGSIIGTGSGVGVNENQLGWGTTANSFLLLNPANIDYDNNYDMFKPFSFPVPLIDSTKLSNSLEVYYDKVTILGDIGSWGSTTTVPNTISYSPNNFAVDLKVEMDNNSIDVMKHTQLCGLIKNEVVDIKYNIVETDKPAGIVLGTVSYQLQLVEI